MFAALTAGGDGRDAMRSIRSANRSTESYPACLSLGTALRSKTSETLTTIDIEFAYAVSITPLFDLSAAGNLASVQTPS
jgi:hypothetical protein